LLKFTPAVAKFIAGTMPFERRFKCVSVIAVSHFHDENEKQRAETILGKISQQAPRRNLLAHSQFEALKDGGVKFTPVRQAPHDWSKEDFETRYAEIQRLAEEFKQVIAKVKIPKDYSFDVEAGMINYMGSAHALLHSTPPTSTDDDEDWMRCTLAGFGEQVNMRVKAAIAAFVQKMRRACPLTGWIR
jgi:hypothetical protein